MADNSSLNPLNPAHALLIELQNVPPGSLLELPTASRPQDDRSALGLNIDRSSRAAATGTECSVFAIPTLTLCVSGFDFSAHSPAPNTGSASQPQATPGTTPIPTLSEVDGPKPAQSKARRRAATPIHAIRMAGTSKSKPRCARTMPIVLRC